MNGSYKTEYNSTIPTSPEAQQWAGWKTALKPAHEPIVMARKPFKGSCVDNVLTHGVGALNIDATRIDNLTDVEKNWTPQRQHVKSTIDLGGAKPGDTQSMYNDAGRYPSNVIGEVEGYQQYFYCPKVNRAERHIGFENNHPTVKPVALMKYLVKLVTPAGGKVLDPFTGSGSTGMAAVELDYDFTGCELDADYVAIANNRITAWKNKTDLENNLLPEEWFEEE
jgi:site-specific DNA-methyltransferase (adenine-specific)